MLGGLWCVMLSPVRMQLFVCRVIVKPGTLSVWGFGKMDTPVVCSLLLRSQRIRNLMNWNLVIWNLPDSNWGDAIGCSLELFLLEDGATSTFDEAADALAMASKEGWKRIILVTDEFHTRRSLLAFKKVFEGSEIEVQVAGHQMKFLAWMTGGSQTVEYSLTCETIKYRSTYCGTTSPIS